MELEQHKEAEEKIQVVVHGHCSMGPAILGRQVVHTHGLVGVAVVGLAEEGKEHQAQGLAGKDATAVGCHRGEEGDHNQAPLAAPEVGSKEFEDEVEVNSGDLFAVVHWFSEFGEVVQL